jgi:thiol:disulfide interchange protein DsbD
VAAVFGEAIGPALQKPVVLYSFAGLMALLALSMFGFYELQMPSFVQSRVTETSNRLKGGSFGGVFAMGALSAVIVGPCATPALAGALGWVATTKDIWLGWWALFSMALGIGAPLLVVGAAGSAFLPKAGGWMGAMKAVGGVMLLGVGVYMISPVIPAVVHMLLWAVLLIVSAIYLHALDPLPPNASGFKKLWKGVGVISLVVGVSLAIGALSGSRDILQPLAGLRASAGVGTAVAATEHGLKLERVKAADFEARLAAAKGKPVMLDFYADWCVSCKELERFTFADPKVQARLAGVTLLQVDVTATTDADKALLKRFNLFGPPGIIFFDANGAEQKTRVVGYQPPEKFLKTLDSVLK